MTSDAHLLNRTVAERLLTRLDPLVLEPKTILILGGHSDFLLAQLPLRFAQATIITTPADVAILPDENVSIDLVICHLSLPYYSDINALFADVQRVLKVGGVFLLSFYGPDTFLNLPNVTLARPDMHDIGDALVYAKLSAPVLDVEFFTVEYDTPDDVTTDLITTGEAQWVSLEHEATQLHYEVVYGHAWKAEAAMPRKWQDEGWSPITLTQKKSTR